MVSFPFASLPFYLFPQQAMEEDLVVQGVLDKYLGQNLNKKQKPLSISEALYCQQICQIMEGLRSQTEASESTQRQGRGKQEATPMPRPGVQGRPRFEGGLR